MEQLARVSFTTAHQFELADQALRWRAYWDPRSSDQGAGATHQ